MERQDLQSRVLDLKYFIDLGRKLESVIEDSQDIEAVQTSLNSLEAFLTDYQKLIKADDKYQKSVEEQKARRELWLSDYSYLYGSREKAEEFYDTPIEDPLKKARVESIEAFLYGSIAWISAPFSRKISKRFLELRNSFKRSAQAYMRLYNANVSLEKANVRVRNLYLIHKKEFEEAKTASFLEKMGADEKVTYDILQKPELLQYAVLEEIKDKYVPWL